MKRIIFSVFIIATTFLFSVSAQTLPTKQTFDDGIKFANKGAFETALTYFRTSLSLAKNEQTSSDFFAKVHFNIGVCLYQIKRQESSINEFERAIEFNPNYEKAFYALGMAQFELGNYDESEKAFHGAIRLNSKNGENWFDLAFVYLARKDYQSAQKAFENSVCFKSVSALIGRNNLGVIYAINGDFDAAIREFEFVFKNSNGNLKAAERNLQFCRSYRQNAGKDLIAKLEFTNNQAK